MIRSSKKFLVGPVLGVLISALIVGGYIVGSKPGFAQQEGAGEHGIAGEGGNEGGGEGGGSEAGEAAMSSPIIPLGQSWNGVLGGLAVSMQYDSATQSVYGTVRNTLASKLCYVQAEPHLKLGTATVGELGPEKLGDLNPGQQVTSSLSVTSEPALAGVAYDGYVIHMEVFDCAGPGPVAHTASGEEGGGALLALDETFDTTRSGARLILSYHAPSNSFRGAVENTTDRVLRRVRVEVHLSNGAELGPTVPADLRPGEVRAINLVNLATTPASFTGWTAHAEVGGGEGGGEGAGEHGGGGAEGGGEHGGGGEGAGEHGGEGRGGD
ncbi:MAG: hypothetical protein OXM87_12650 [Truepera sp.]|nr:hypothetical protein [Truepera sp.]